MMNNVCAIADDKKAILTNSFETLIHLSINSFTQK